MGDAGIRIQELYLQIEVGDARVFAGKFDVDFGVAWDAAFGVYGTDLAEDYEYTDRVGAGVEIALRMFPAGEHSVQGAVFFADTSALSGDLISGRDRVRRSDGGISNTETPASFSVSLRGGGFEWFSGLNYSADFSLQSAGRGNAHDQLGLSLALAGTASLSTDLAFEWLGEFVQLHQADGGDDDRAYVTLSGKFGYRGAWFAPSLTRRFDAVESGPDTDVTLATVSIGYDFECGFGLSAGFQLFDAPGEKRELFGFNAEYVFEF